MLRLEVVDGPGRPGDEPVGLLVPIHAVGRLLRREERVLRPLPDLNRGPAISRDVLIAGGTALLFERAIWIDDAGLAYGDNRRTVGIRRLVFSTMRVDELNFQPDPGPMNAPFFTASPDGETVAILQGSVFPVAGRILTPSDQRITLLLAAFDGLPARIVLTVQGSVAGEADDHLLQWSPDGRWIALSLRPSSDPAVYAPPCLHIVEARTGTVVSRLPGWRLCGSASWSPSGGHLLVADGSFRPTVCTFDLRTQALTTVVPVSGRPQSPTLAGARRPLGLADEQRVLVGTRRGTTMTLSAGDISGPDLEPLLRWTGELDMYPVLAQMPLGYWQ